MAKKSEKVGVEVTKIVQENPMNLSGFSVSKIVVSNGAEVNGFKKRCMDEVTSDIFWIHFVSNPNEDGLLGAVSLAKEDISDSQSFTCVNVDAIVDGKFYVPLANYGFRSLNGIYSKSDGICIVSLINVTGELSERDILELASTIANEFGCEIIDFLIKEDVEDTIKMHTTDYEPKKSKKKKKKKKKK